MTVPVWVGVDIGGTKVLAAVVDESGRVRRTARRETPPSSADPRVSEDAIVEAVREVADGRPVAGVGLAAAGWVDAECERIRFAPHLAWRDAPVRAVLEERLGVPVVLDNDANCAAVAEWTYGAAVGASSVLMLTLGTGIGGALLQDGRVLRGLNGMAGEFGHMVVVPEGEPCPCGGRGCWEQYCSGTALVRYVRSRIGVEPTTLAEASLTGPLVTEAAEAGDLVARQAFAFVGEWLGRGVAGLLAALDPAVVVVGGGVAAAGERLLEPARAEMTRRLPGAGHRTVPPLVAATLGPEAGVVGAVVRARAGAR